MSRVSPAHGLPRRLFLGLRFTTVVVAGMLLTAAAVAFAQNDDARFANWSKVESATETRTYRDAIRAGGAFDAAARGFLEEIALPQLELEANRTTIERVRKRLREFLLADFASDKVADEANKTCLSFMQALAGKEDADAVVRVNAMLMIGELQSVERKPWQPAAAVLAQAAANTELPKAVRIAACVGLARHVEGTKGVVEEQQRMAAVAVPAIVTILKEPPLESAKSGMVENDWMASRCLTMLPWLGPLAPATATEVVRILNDDKRSINVRVRAAAALAAVAGPESNVDKAAVIQSIGAVAIVALERDVAAADKLLLDRQYGGGAGQGPPGMMPPGMMPGMPPGMPPGMMPPGMGVDPSVQPAVEQMIPREVCRRAAWRLAILADAILTDDSKRGIAVLGGGAAPAAVELAQELRRAAMELDAEPEEITLRQSLTGLKPPAPAAPVVEEAADGAPAAATKRAPAAAAK